MFLFNKKNKPAGALPEHEFLYPLSLNDWMKEFDVSSKFQRDSISEMEIKRIVIQRALLYNRCNQNKELL